MAKLFESTQINTLGLGNRFVRIDRIVEAFGRAASRAQQAGFDGVQIHAGHGYLLSQFLSPFYNQRKDSYGGPIEKRARIIREVFASVRGNTGRQFPI